MRNTVLLLILLVACSLNAQSGFDVTYGPTVRFARSIDVASDNGFVVCANVDLPWMHTQLLRINSNGDTLWTKSYGDDSTQYKTYDMIGTSDGGYLLSGDYQEEATSPNMDSYVMKVDSLGSVLWFNKFGRSDSENGGKDFANEVDELQNGGCVAVGWAKHAFSPSNNVIALSGWAGYISTFDSVGNEIESRTLLFYFEPDTSMILGSEMPIDVEVIGDRIFVADNYSSQTNSTTHGRVVALNTTLDTLFSFRLGQGDAMEGLGVTIDDHLLIVSDSSLIKIDTLGNVIWQQSLVLHSATAVREFSGGKIIVLEGCSGDMLHRDAIINSLISSGQKVIFHSFSSSGVSLFSDTVAFFNLATIGAGDFVLTSDSLITFAGVKGSQIWIYQFRDSIGPFSTSIAESVATNSPSIFPNPASEQITISGNMKVRNYEILTSSGQSSVISGETSGIINVGDLSEGIYILVLTDPEGGRTVFRLVKLHSQ